LKRRRTPAGREKEVDAALLLEQSLKSDFGVMTWSRSISFRRPEEAVPPVRRKHLLLSLLLVGLSGAGCASSAPRAAAPRPASQPALITLDADGDGFPDASEIHSASDRENFRGWFAAIAESQFYRTSEAWNKEQQDCAGLVRFSVREALRAHDRLWFQKMGWQNEATIPDVRSLKIPDRQLGEKIFRTDFGSYRADDLETGKFSEFADARTLKNYNTVFVSRDRREARAGDLLFFHQPWVQKYPYHVMIFLGAPRENSEGAADWVIYHTGSAPDSPEGTVKRVRLAVLDGHPDKRWRPQEGNSNFLGFYRLKILD
jgi:uncharacterized protein YfaT (DUF1175 family)